MTFDCYMELKNPFYLASKVTLHTFKAQKADRKAITDTSFALIAIENLQPLQIWCALPS